MTLPIDRVPIEDCPDHYETGMRAAWVAGATASVEGQPHFCHLRPDHLRRCWFEGYDYTCAGHSETEHVCAGCNCTVQPLLYPHPSPVHFARRLCPECFVHMGWEPKPSDAPRRRKPIPSGLRFRCFERDGYRCAYCGRHREQLDDGEYLVADHVTPVADDGPTDLDNLVSACNTCNEGKSASTTRRFEHHEVPAHG